MKICLDNVDDMKKFVRDIVRILDYMSGINEEVDKEIEKEICVLMGE